MSIVDKAEQIAKLFVEIVTEVAKRLEALEGGGGGEQYGTLNVTTEPTGALIYIDDKYVGKSPYTALMEPDNYVVFFGDIEDYDTPEDVHTRIIAGETTRIHAIYEPNSGDTINDYMVQYGNVNLEAIGKTKYDLIIIDYAKWGDAASKWTKEQITTLQTSPGGPKKVLAYICPTMASDYRYYWGKDWRPGYPKFIGHASSWGGTFGNRFGGSYWVHYWDLDWQKIMFGESDSYLNQIIEQGFDGVFFDVIDAFWIWPNRPTAKEELADFITDMSIYAHKRKPGFMVVCNGGEQLFEYSEYVAGITGVMKESVYYGWGGDNVQTPANVTEFAEANLDRFVGAGKQVYVLNYTQTPSQVNESYRRAKNKGYINWCGVSSLDRLIVNPGHEPD